MSETKKLKVLVCGTTFGRIYVDAINRLKEEYELIGIMSRGSEHTKEIAKNFNVPVYTSLEKINKENVDLACVVVRSTVVGGSGSNIAKDLLKKGINVMQEHPVHKDDLIECFKLAQRNKCLYKLNGFYTDLDSVEEFLNTLNKIKKSGEIRYIEGSCAVQVLYPMLEIMGKISGGFKPYNFNLISESSFPLKTISGKIKNIPTQITIQNEMNPKDPDNNGQLLHRIVVATSLGNLMLTNSHGPVVWQPNMFVPRDESGLLKIYEGGGSLKNPLSEEVFKKDNFKQSDIFTDLWPLSLKKSLKKYHEEIIENKRLHNHMQFVLSATEIWQDWSKMIGQANLIDYTSNVSKSLKDIFEEVEELK